MRLQWLLAIAVIFSCRPVLAAHALPDNTDSAYFRTLGHGIVITSNVSPTGIFFHLKLKVKKKLPAKSIIVAEFENPMPRYAPLEVIVDRAPAGQEINILSPSMPCLTMGRYYRTIVTLYADATRRNILSTHVQIIAFFPQHPIPDTQAECPAH